MEGSSRTLPEALTEEERLALETDYFECGCTIHISVAGDTCGLHKMSRLEHGITSTGPVPEIPKDVLSINPNKKRKDVSKEG